MKISPMTMSAIVALGAAYPLQTFAQKWPEKNVRILVPFPPGGGTDIQARLLSTEFQKRMGQNFIIDNRTGAGGLIAGQLAVESPPDGNTIFFTSGSISVVVTLYAKRMKFDVHKDLQPVSWISSTPLVLSLHPSVPAKSVAELVSLAKRTGGGMNAAGNSAGSTAHLTAEMFNQTVGIKSTVLTYRGGGPATIALISGEVDYIFATAPSIMPHLKAGRAKALAVTTAKKSSALPDLPTMDSMYPGFISDNWYAMFFPAGTSQEIVNKLNTEIRHALGAAEIKTFFLREALEPVASSPTELLTMLDQEIKKYARVIKQANIQTQ
jgi:tripartite-type tricarboxylate transporter receptor subunit TctC